MERLSEWKVFQKALLAKKGIEQTGKTTVCGTDTGGVCDPDRFSKWFRSFCYKNGYAHYTDKDGNALPTYRYNEKGVEVDEHGRPFSRTNKKLQVKKFYKGLKYHELRHTQASLLLADGVDLKTVQGRLGHAEGAMTIDFYAHLQVEQDRRAARSISSLRAG